MKNRGNIDHLNDEFGEGSSSPRCSVLSMYAPGERVLPPANCDPQFSGSVSERGGRGGGG